MGRYDRPKNVRNVKEGPDTPTLLLELITMEITVSSRLFPCKRSGYIRSPVLRVTVQAYLELFLSRISYDGLWFMAFLTTKIRVEHFSTPVDTTGHTQVQYSQ